MRIGVGGCGVVVEVAVLLGSELRLSRTTLGSGIFIVKVGTFTIKIKF